MTGFESHPRQGPVTPVRDRACAAPRPWLLAAPVKPGPWRLLVYLWTYGPHWKPEDPLPGHGDVTAWPSQRTAARELDKPLSTIKKWTQRLAADGWIKRGADGWALSVGTPCEEWKRAQVSQPSPLPKSDKGDSCLTKGSQLAHRKGDSCLTKGSQLAHPYDPPLILHGSSTSPPHRSEPEPLTLIAQEHVVTVDHAADLRALHDRLRREALRSHGRKCTALPKPATAAGRSLDRRIAAALAAHGLETCTALLEYRAAEWREDLHALSKWSREQVWSDKAIEFALGALDAGPVTSRRGPGVEAAPNPREPAQGDTELSPDPDPEDEPPAWGDDFFGHAGRAVVVTGS